MFDASIDKQLSVSTSTLNGPALWSFDIQVSYQNYPAVTSTPASFKINIIDCAAQTLTLDTANTAFPTPPTFSVFLNAPASTICWADSDVTESYSPTNLCGPFKYEITDALGNLIGPPLFDTSTDYFLFLQTSNIADVGTIGLIVRVWYPNYGGVVGVKPFDIIVEECTPTTISSAGAYINTIDYIIGTGPW